MAQNMIRYCKIIIIIILSRDTKRIADESQLVLFKIGFTITLTVITYLSDGKC